LKRAQIQKLPPFEKSEHGRIAGVRYNVVRRPLSGGTGSIHQKKPSKSNPKGETKEEFYTRVAAIINEEPERFFMRWRVEVIHHDLTKFQSQFLNPILEQLWDWWEWITTHLDDPFNGTHPEELGGNGIHWRTPYGFFNVLAEGGSEALDEYLHSGSTLGLEKAQNLFGELA
jgi:hypothetical protein